MSDKTFVYEVPSPFTSETFPETVENMRIECNETFAANPKLAETVFNVCLENWWSWLAHGEGREDDAKYHAWEYSRQKQKLYSGIFTEDEERLAADFLD